MTIPTPQAATVVEVEDAKLQSTAGPSTSKAA